MDTAKVVRMSRLAEPYDRHKSLDLRRECYHRGTRPTRTGPHANDNKVGYIALLRAYDNGASLATPAASAPLSGPHVSSAAEARTLALSPADSASTDSDTTEPAATTQPSVRSRRGTCNGRTKPSADKRPASSDDSKKKRPLARKSARTETVAATEPTLSVVSTSESPVIESSDTTAQDADADTDTTKREHKHKRLKVEYTQLKLQALRETREIDRARHRDEQRLKLHMELQSIIATIAQLYRQAKEYALESHTALLADANDDIAFFQARKREIKHELRTAHVADGSDDK